MATVFIKMILDIELLQTEYSRSWPSTVRVLPKEPRWPKRTASGGEMNPHCEPITGTERMAGAGGKVSLVLN